MNEKRNITEGNKFSVDYSKRGTAKCNKCKKQITKGEIRIGKSVAFKAKYILQYYHVECVFDSFHKARLATNIITSINEIDGLDSITEEEKSRFISLIDDANAKRTKPLPRPPATKVQKSVLLQESSKSRKNPLKSLNLPSIKVMFTNADQLTSSKMIELRKNIEEEKPLIVAVCEVKPKNAKEHTVMDYEIPHYSLHPVNLDNNTGRGIAVYSHCSLDKSTIQIEPILSFEEACLLEVRLRGGDILLFGCCYRSPTATETSDQNNGQLNRLLKCISKKNYSHKCIVGDLTTNI
jgi:hypothetical protein